MANRNDNWGFEGRGSGRSGRGDEERRWEGGEHRAFEDGDDAARRYGARFDRDRTGYRRNSDERTGYQDRGDRYGYRGGGQEYGVAAGGWRSQQDHDYGRQDRERWTPGEGPYGEVRRTGPNRGVEAYGQPSDYAYRPQGDHDFDPDYLRWRDEQLSGHDRDYSEWRRAQHRQYDDEYRKFRHERRTQFGDTFQSWRNQRSAVGGVPDTSVAPGVSHGGDRSSDSGGWRSSNDAKPSGMLDPSLNMSSDPALSQTGAGGHGGGGSSAPTGGAASSGSEFGKEPPQVQSAADGGTTRGADETRKDEDKGRR